jgi:tetratricopeptide (TPR) repeat protein
MKRDTPMLDRLHPFLLAAMLVAGILPVSWLEARDGGWIRGTVVDDEGSLIAGVTVTVTSPAMPDFSDETRSNKKGRFRIMVSNAGPPYELSLSKEGYAALVVKVHPVPGGTSTVEAVMAPAGAPPPQITASSPTAADVYNAGVDALEAGDLDTAVTRLREVIEIDSDIAVVHYFLSRAYLERGEYAEAAAAAGTALELDPTEARARFVCYRAYRALGDEHRASEALAEIKGSGEADAAAKRIYNEGAAAYGAGNMTTAETMFLVAVEIDPDLPEAYAALAEIHRLQGDPGQSLEMANRVLELRPGDALALRSRFNALLSLQRIDELEKAVDELAAADPAWATTRLPELALAAFNQNLIDAAVVLYAKAVEVDPDNADAHYKLGLCSFNQGDSARAGEAMKRFLELAPDHPDAAAARSMLEYVD